jgi:hypothetical protein
MAYFPSAYSREPVPLGTLVAWLVERNFSPEISWVMKVSFFFTREWAR